MNGAGVNNGRQAARSSCNSETVKLLKLLSSKKSIRLSRRVSASARVPVNVKTASMYLFSSADIFTAVKPVFFSITFLMLRHLPVIIRVPQNETVHFLTSLFSLLFFIK
jgi:hypothetical protein